MYARKLLILLLAGSLYAQQESTKVPPEDKIVQAGPGLTVAERHDQLRRGREDDFAVVLCTNQLRFGGCGIDPHPNQKGITPLTFSINAPVWLNMRYRDGRKYHTLVSGAPVRLVSNKKTLTFKMVAGDDAPVGLQNLHVRVFLQVAQPGGSIRTEQISTDFPIVVTGHNASVEETGWPFGSQFGPRMKSIAVAPLVPFEYLLLFIACSRGCDL